MKNNIKKNKIKIIAAIIGILLSFFLLKPVLKSEKVTSYSMDYLNQKEKNVLAVTAAATTASVALAAVPGDATTPVADKLADVSGYTAVILSAVIFEKYMVPAAGTLVSVILIPAGLILLIGYFIFNKHAFKAIGIRLFLLSAVLVCVIPVSVMASKSVENVYQNKMTETIDSSESMSSSDDETSDDTSEDHWWQRLENAFNDSVDTIKNSAEGAVEQCKTLLSNFMELIAVMIVTSFLIPIAALVLMYWMLKLIFNVSSGPQRMRV